MTNADLDSIQDDHGCSLPLCPCCVCDLLAEVERLRSMEDATQAGFNEMLTDLGKARIVIQTLGKERDAALMAETKAQLEVARLREAK